MRFLIRAIPFAIIVIVIWYVGLFSFYNQGYVALEAPYFGNFHIAITLAMLFCFVSGALLALCYFGVDSWRKSKEIKNLKKALSSELTPAPAITTAEPN